jgi:DNA repair exonuclease SbcCD ATPase subunit
MFKTVAECERAIFALDAQFQEVHHRLLELAAQRDKLPAAKNPGLVPYLERTLAERTTTKPEDIPYLQDLLVQARQELAELEKLDAQIRLLQEQREQLLQQKITLAQELERLIKLEQKPSNNTVELFVTESIISEEAVQRPGAGG